MTGTQAPFQPGPLLRSPHLQTILGSRGRGFWVRRRAAEVLARAEQQILTSREGIRLEAWVSRQDQPAPGIILIHGWLGHADSSYVLSAAAEFWAQGYSVARLNLRDHGATAHLNEEMFHSGRTGEVVQAVEQLADRTGARTGLVGYSLGGNFALRVARATGIETVAVCPAIDPPATMASIDGGFIGYRLFFLLKWQRALQSKERAFPHRYQFESARQLRTVSALTELFVREHTDYPDTATYFDAYTLTGTALADTRASVIYAADDPVIPEAGFESLPAGIERIATRHGGHCAFISHPARPTWCDRYLVRHFDNRLRSTPASVGRTEPAGV